MRGDIVKIAGRQFINSAVAGLAAGWLPADFVSTALADRSKLMDTATSDSDENFGLLSTELTGGLALADDYFFAEPPGFDWLREGTSFWLFEDNGEFAIPRIGIEAEPHSWENRRYNGNFSFADGRVLLDHGMGKMHSPFDRSGNPAILGAGPFSFKCIEPFRKWHVSYEGTAIETHVENQIAGTVNQNKRTPLKYEVELNMVVPPWLQDVPPEKFFTWQKGKQRDALSVGLGWRFEQMLRGEGILHIDGSTRDFKLSGMRVKRRSVRTDGLSLRGHCWQCAVFPDGRAFGYLAYPPHDDGYEPWNEGFIYQDGKMYQAQAVQMPWLGDDIAVSGQDVSLELQSDLGITRIQGKTVNSTWGLRRAILAGFSLQQSGVAYVWEGQESYGMLERSRMT